jgi:hypothetical protein
LAILQSNP